MPQTKYPVLEKMRAAASSKQITDDFPALIALLDSLDFWRKRKEDPALCRNFVQIVFNSENYGLSYEALEETADTGKRRYGRIARRIWSTFSIGIIIIKNFRLCCSSCVT